MSMGYESLRETFWVAMMVRVQMDDHAQDLYEVARTQNNDDRSSMSHNMYALHNIIPLHPQYINL
jgi:hypothetical protein